jgi:hypothetical protein
VAPLNDTQQMVAWDTLVMNADPSKFPQGDIKRSAAIASIYMGIANNGGINHYLTFSYALDGIETYNALIQLGANTAAKEFKTVLEQLGDPMKSTSQDNRWNLMEKLWTEKFDALDLLTVEADQDIVSALTKHIQEHGAFYLGLK